MSPPLPPAGRARLTPAQQAAIDTIDTSLVVSAAAGSGKTTVLAERCVGLVCDAPREKRCGIDELLVVTFTEAAAEEMRTRIRTALRRRLDETPGSEYLQRQIYGLECASISTIHAFCKNIIERYFPQAEVDPQASVLSEEEAALLRDETLDEMFRGLYASGDEEAIAFQTLVDDYGAGRDPVVARTILQIHQFISSLSDPEAWLERSLRRMDPADPQGLASALDDCQRLRLHEELQAQMDYCRHLSGVLRAAWPVAEMHAEAVDEHYFTLQAWLRRLRADEPRCWERVTGEIRDFAFERAKPPPRKITDEEKAAFEAAKRLRDGIKDLFRKRLKERLCLFTRDELQAGIARTAPCVETLVGLVRRFDSLYSTAKARQAVVDFNDLQRKAFKLLADPADPSRPGAVARDLQRQYRYVLVDEFQDVDPLQESILRLVSRESADPPAGNLFTVGDIKQSIYRFRLAEPRLFTARAERFAGGGDIGRVIHLQENFRSRRAVIDAINLIFTPLMSRDFGGSEYDDKARLHAGAVYPAGTTGPVFGTPAVELHLLEPVIENTRPAKAEAPDGDEFYEERAGEEEASEGDELDGVQREAYLIGRLVRHWMGQGEKRQRWHVAGRPDAAGGEPGTRPIEYGDVVILLRSLPHKAEPIADVLRRLGIPVRIERQCAALETTEFRDCVNALRLLDNGQQDIPLAAVLRSPLLGEPFNESDLLRVRLFDRDGPFHAAFHRYATDGPPDPLQDRVRSVLAVLDRYRTRIQRTPVSDVLWELCNEFNYLSYVCGLPDGARRRDHLVRLHELARQFGRFSRQGLRRFLHFIDELAEQDRQPREASAGGNENCVRIMTIHASKGLEFPVVILADMHKRFNPQDLRQTVLVDRDQGIAMRAVDSDRRVLYPTLAHQLATETATREGRSEELRVLYVALTRAREHLVLVGRVEPERVAHFRAMQTPGPDEPRPLPRLLLETAQSPLDWLLTAVSTAPNGATAWPDAMGDAAGAIFTVNQYPRATTDAWRIPPAVAPERAEALARLARLEALPADEPTGQIEAARRTMTMLANGYPAKSLTRLPARLSVGEIKRRWDARQEPDERAPAPPIRTSEPPRPGFLTQAPLPDAAVRGSATHRFLQLVDLERSCDLADLRDQLAALTTQGRITPADAGAVLLDAAAWFFDTELGRRVRAHCGLARREVPFDARMRPEDYDPSAAACDPRDVILVRGVVDLLLCRPGEIELIDYKTDAVPAAECAARADRYTAQIQTYASAMESILKKPIRSCWLVFLQARTLVQLSR